MSDETLIVGSTWNYGADPANSDIDHVRELIQDTDPEKAKLSDGTIALALVERKNVYFAAAKLCRMLAARYADRPALSHEGLSEQWPTLVDNYRKLADRYEEDGQQSADVASGVTSPQSIQQSLAAIAAEYDDSDRNSPLFSEGMLYDSRFDPRR